jgi:hypothetical protein
MLDRRQSARDKVIHGGVDRGVFGGAKHGDAPSDTAFHAKFSQPKIRSSSRID